MVISIWNSIGIKILEEKITQLINEINTSNFVDGVYFYNISSNYNILKSGKLMKLKN
jgi:hypothetical protein